MPIPEPEQLTGNEAAIFLAHLAHELTVCARGETYEAGTERVLEPELLRAFNEVQHRVTGSLRDYLIRQEGMSVEDVLEMIREFGHERHHEKAIDWAIRRAQSHQAAHRAPWKSGE